MVFRAVLDANVMVGARQRDVLLTLAEAGVYAPIWSGEILSEVGRHVPEEVSTALVREMRQAFPDSDRGSWPGMASLMVALAGTAVNQKDRHVLALALCAGADVVVTGDATLREELEEMDVEAQSASAFVSYAVDVDPALVRVALVDMARRRWRLLGSDETVLERVEAWGKKQGWSWSVT